MGYFEWSVIGFFTFSIIIILLVSKESPDDDTISNASTINELRSRQIKGLREHAVKRKFEEAVETRTKNKKKYEMDEILLRAGLTEWSYGEFVLTKVGIALITLMMTWLFFGNPVITLVGAFITYLIPGTVIQSIANRRVAVMERDIGTFIQLTAERYKVHGDFQLAVKQSAPDFEGHEPMYSEIRKTILDFNVGMPTAEAMLNMGTRTGNKFISQLGNYYDIASKIGTEASRDKIIGQAWENFNEDYKMRQQHEMEINGPKKDAYLIVGAMPILVLYQATVDEMYIDFFLNTPLGRIGLTAILVTITLSFIFINKKIGAPLD